MMSDACVGDTTTWTLMLFIRPCHAFIFKTLMVTWINGSRWRYQDAREARLAGPLKASLFSSFSFALYITRGGRQHVKRHFRNK